MIAMSTILLIGAIQIAIAPYIVSSFGEIRNLLEHHDRVFINKSQMLLKLGYHYNYDGVFSMVRNYLIYKDQKYLAKAQEKLRHSTGIMASYRQLIKTKHEKELAIELKELTKELQRRLDQAKIRSLNKGMIQDLANVVSRDEEKVFKIISGLREILVQQAMDSRKSIYLDLNAAKRSLLFIGGLILLITMSLVFFMFRIGKAKLSRRLNVISKAMTDLSKEKLDISLEGIETDKDEIGEMAKSVQKFRENILDRDKAVADRQKMERILHNRQKLELLGMLSRGIAHEVNTPLQYIKMNLYFIGEQISFVKNILSKIRKNKVEGNDSQRLKKIVNEIDNDEFYHDLTEATKDIEEGMGQISTIVNTVKLFSTDEGTDKRKFSVKDVINSSIILSQSQRDKIAKVTVKIDDDLPMVMGFPNEINQVILSLLSNSTDAIKTHKKGELGLIEIEVSRLDDKVIIIFKDDGGGIPDEIKNKIFDPFFSTKETENVSNQGLFECSNYITNNHNGEISFEVNEGIGTIFTISLSIDETTRKGLVNEK